MAGPPARSNSAHDPTSKIPAYKLCAVRVEAIPAGAGTGRAAAVPPGA